MNHIIPQAPLEEEQRLSRTLLTTHILHRSLNISPIFGAVFGGSVYSLQRLADNNKLPSALQKRIKPIPALPWSQLLLRTSYKGIVYTVPIMGVGLVVRMWGKEEIEWQDRAWRILGSAGQNQTDVWSSAGMVLGGAAGGVYGTGMTTARRVLGGAGLGGLAGIGGMMVWRQMR